MPVYIIHKDGAYNLFSTISDGCHYESALTRTQVFQVLPQDSAAVEERLARAEATGCSDRGGMTLEECIECNRAGPNETELPFDQFVRQYLTLGAIKAKESKE